jgi:hypothetical protein
MPQRRLACNDDIVGMKFCKEDGAQALSNMLLDIYSVLLL